MCNVSWFSTKICLRQFLPHGCWPQLIYRWYVRYLTYHLQISRVSDQAFCRKIMTKAEHYVNAATMFESRSKHRNCVDIVLSLSHKSFYKNLITPLMIQIKNRGKLKPKNFVWIQTDHQLVPINIAFDIIPEPWAYILRTRQVLWKGTISLKWFICP